MIVLPDAGPLIALAKLNRLNLLAELYPALRIVPAVYREVVDRGLQHGAPDALTVRLAVQHYRWSVIDVPGEVVSSYEPQAVLHAGEREVLALARSLSEVLVLLDDEVARAEARRLSVTVKGTLGVLVQAHRANLLTLEEVELLVLEVAGRPDIWIGEKLCREVLARLRPVH